MMEWYIPNKIIDLFKRERKPASKKIERLEKDRLTAAISNKLNFVLEEEMMKHREYMRRMTMQILKEEIR